MDFWQIHHGQEGRHKVQYSFVQRNNYYNGGKTNLHVFEERGVCSFTLSRDAMLKKLRVDSRGIFVELSQIMFDTRER